MAAAIAAAMITPIVWMAGDARSGGWAVVESVWRADLPGLLGRTLLLTGLTTLAAATLGTMLASIVVRTDVPFARILFWLCALPLAIPSFVAAVAYTDLLGPRGPVDRAIGYGGIYGLDGATATLTLTLFPYVFLVVAGALKLVPRETEEAARVLGNGPLAALCRVSIPAVSTAVAAGAMLVAFHVLAEYPTVAWLRYDTFAREIFAQLAEFGTARSATAVLSLVLVAVTLLVVAAEIRFSRRGEAAGAAPGAGSPDRLPLGRLRWPAFAIVVAIAAASVGVPLGWLVHQAGWGPVTPGGLSGGFTSLSGETLSDFVTNSLLVAGAATALCLLLALPGATLGARHRGPVPSAVYTGTQAGYAVPGIVMALVLIGMVAGPLKALAGSVTLIVLGHVVRLLPESLQSSRGSLAAVPAVAIDASRSLGHGSFATFARVSLPVAAPGIIAGGLLVFLSAIKEVPATLLLRPPGFDTLAVRVWLDSSEGLYRSAAPAALWLIALSAVALVSAIFLVERTPATRRLFRSGRRGDGG